MEEQGQYFKKKKQLSLFEVSTESQIVCYICNKNPLSKNGKGVLWNGFRDNDLNVLVCFSCQEEHYKKKNLTEYKNKYSEFPVPLT